MASEQEEVQMSVQPIPEGYHTITPYLSVQGAAKVIEFIKKSFGAEEVQRSQSPEGRIYNAEIRIGDSMLMIADANPGGERPGTLYMYVADPDLLYRQAMSAGAKSLREPTDEFYGDRCAGVADFAGNQWWVAKRIRDVSADEVARVKKQK
jgi:uncharacterized glyoxalase superfamily protein PhnB